MQTCVVESQRGNYSSLESSGDKESIRNLNPHPPTEPSTDRARRRPKVCSAGKDKGGLNSAGSRGKVNKIIRHEGACVVKLATRITVLRIGMSTV